MSNANSTLPDAPTAREWDELLGHVRGAKWQISKGVGYLTKWRGDGKELFYYAADGQLMAVPIQGDAALEIGTPVPLFSPRLLNGPNTGFSCAIRRRSRRPALPAQCDGRGHRNPSNYRRRHWTAGMNK